ncbi:hypothetical protein ABTX15_17025 [Micromonospora sp. NPDC094482]|uniref:hypothetical protein n=1 Tax=unclassified Micromonospora TaxID=2617518 RepID=UPI00332A4564
MSTGLDRAVGQLYAAFGRHPRPTRTAHCPHCVRPDEVAALLGAPLRALTAEQLCRYAGKAGTTWGDLADLRYFLPRLLELLAAGRLDDPLVPDKLLSTVGEHWRSWPTDEQQAIEAYLDAWWRRTLRDFPAPVEVAEVLAAIGATGVDLRPYLSTWAGDGGQPAARHLAEHLAYWQPDDRRPWARAVRAWHASGAPARVLEAALLAADDPAIAEEISAGYDVAAPLWPIR